MAAFAASLTAPSVSVPPSVPPALTADTVCESERSTSENAISPLSLSVGMLASSVMLPRESVRTALMRGVSLAPVTVTEMDCFTEEPWLSLIVTTNVSTAVWPLAR